MTLDLGTIVAFVLVLARAGAWIVAAPVFGGRGLTSVARLALSLSLALFIAPLAADDIDLSVDTGQLIVLLFGQIIVGLLLGWGIGVLLSAFEAAGATVDVLGGFSIGAVFDPLTGNNSPVFARLFNLVFVTLLFATGAYRAMVAGFVRSFEVVPVDLFPDVSLDWSAAGRLLATMLVAAVQMAAPVLGALFLTEVALAVAARFAPQANIFLVGLPLKVLVTMLLAGTILTVFPVYLESLLDSSLRAADGMIGG